MTDEVVFGGMAAVPFITALLQMFKGWVPTKFLPFLALILGVGWNVGLTVGTDEFSRTTIFLGLVVGLAASGLYSAAKATAEEVTDRISWPNGSSD